MTEVAIARINTFGPSPKAGFESPSDQLIVLTYAQLQDLIKGAIEQAIQPLQDGIAQLREEIDQDRQDIAALRLKTASLEKDRDTLSENQLIQLRLINDLRAVTKKDAQPLQKDRGEILRALIAANGGKMLAKEARQKMRLDKVLFSQLLAKAEDIEIRPYKMDKRQKLLVLN